MCWEERRREEVGSQSQEEECRSQRAGRVGVLVRERILEVSISDVGQF